jgi:energy-coupling factor transporter transmembrane protein EcfT
MGHNGSVLEKLHRKSQGLIIDYTVLYMYVMNTPSTFFLCFYFYYSTFLTFLTFLRLVFFWIFCFFFLIYICFLLIVLMLHAIPYSSKLDSNFAPFGCFNSFNPPFIKSLDFSSSESSSESEINISLGTNALPSADNGYTLDMSI